MNKIYYLLISILTYMTVEAQTIPHIEKFHATISDGVGLAHWKSNSQLPQGKYIVELLDNENNITIHDIFTVHTSQKHGEALYNYSCSVSGLTKTGMYSFRLKELVEEGKDVYHGNARVNIEPVMSSYSLNIFPNPAKTNGYIVINLPTTQHLSIKITDGIGRTVSHLHNDITEAGEHQFKFKASFLRAGTYFVKIKADTFSDTKQVVVTHD